MTIHHIVDYMTQTARHDAFMRRHPIDDIPCDVEPPCACDDCVEWENNMRPDGTQIIPTEAPKGKDA